MVTEETELHPEIAFQAGIPQEKKSYDIHPSLQAEVQPEEPAPEQPVVESSTDSVEETVQNALSINQEPVQPQPESTKDKQWRALREKADRLDRLEHEKEAADRERDFYKEQALRQQHIAKEQDDDYRTETEKQIQKEVQELKQQIALQQKETAQAKQQAALSRAEQRLAQDYPDIKEVVSDENIKRLEYEYPHLYNSVVASSDIYTVGSAAYEMIMAKGIYQKPKSTLNQIAQSASRNQSKPRSASTVSPQSGESPIKQASNFMGNSISSEEERKALYAEMVSSSRNRV